MNMGAEPAAPAAPIKPATFEMPPEITEHLRTELGCPKAATIRVALDFTNNQKDKIETIVKKTFSHLYGASPFAIKGISGHHEVWMRYALKMANLILLEAEELVQMNAGTAANQIRGVLDRELVDWSNNRFKLPSFMTKLAKKYNRRGYNSTVERRGLLVGSVRARIGVAKNRGHGTHKYVKIKTDENRPNRESNNKAYKLRVRKSIMELNILRSGYAAERKWGDAMLQSIPQAQQQMFGNFRPPMVAVSSSPLATSEPLVDASMDNSMDASVVSEGMSSLSLGPAPALAASLPTASTPPVVVAALEKRIKTLQLLLQRQKKEQAALVATTTNNLAKKDAEIKKLRNTLAIEKMRTELVETTLTKHAALIEQAEASANAMAIDQVEQNAEADRIRAQKRQAETDLREQRANDQKEQLARLEKATNDKRREEQLRVEEAAEAKRLLAITRLEQEAEAERLEEAKQLEELAVLRQRAEVKRLEDIRLQEEKARQTAHQQAAETQKKQALEKRKKAAFLRAAKAEKLAAKKKQVVKYACTVINEKASIRWTPLRAVSLV